MNAILQEEDAKGQAYKAFASRLPFLLISLFFVILGVVSFHREVLNYGVETDFVGSFVPEATRVLHGEPLQLDFHPPLYSIILALSYAITGDWFKSGLFISLIAALVGALSCYAFFKLKFGKVESVAAVLAIGMSPTFLSHAMQASSDMFFAGLLFAALACIARADERNSNVMWALGGLLTGATILTRTNGITLLVFVLFPLMREGPLRFRIQAAGTFFTGLLVPLIGWSLAAFLTGSPILPGSNYQSLALTYFSGSSDRSSSDALRIAVQGVSSTLDVLAKDPIHLIKTYVFDLFSKVKKVFSADEMLPFPYLQLALPGLFVLMSKGKNRFIQVLGLFLAATVLLLNFKPWYGRFFLFAIPFLGAAAGALIAVAYKASENRRIALRILVIALFISPIYGFKEIKDTVDEHFQSRLAYDALAAAKILTQSAETSMSKPGVIERKGHVAFYAHADWIEFPDVKSLTELQAAIPEVLRNSADRTDVYLFYGSVEKVKRPKLRVLAKTCTSMGWLRCIAAGPESGGWVLYQVLANGPDTSESSSM